MNLPTAISEKVKDSIYLGKHFHRRNQVHVMRKLWHIGAGIIALWVYYNMKSVTREVAIKLAFSIAIVSLSTELLRLRFNDINSFFLKIFGPFMRKNEVSSLSGMPFYALGIASSLFFYQEEIAILSIFFLVFSDPISSYFGIRYGTNKIIPNKSIQGSTAGFCTCYIISLIYGLILSGPNIDLLFFSLLAGLVGSASELLSVFVDDNLTIPLVSGGGLTLLNLIFQIY